MQEILKTLIVELLISYLDGMNVFDCIFNRRSVRRFKKESIDDELIGVMLYSATHAPSAGNVQEWRFVVVKDEKKKKKLAAAALQQDFLIEAPVIIVVCVDLEKISLRYGVRGETLYSKQDTASATMLLMLAAHALGLATCWVGAFDEDEVSHVIELPEKFRPVAIVPVGYAAEVPEKPSRTPIEELTSFNAFGKKYKISYAVGPEQGKEIHFKPLGNYIEEVVGKTRKRIRERKGKKPKKKKITFSEFLKKLGK